LWQLLTDLRNEVVAIGALFFLMGIAGVNAWIHVFANRLFWGKLRNIFEKLCGN
jgi:hypothetical protein